MAVRAHFDLKSYLDAYNDIGPVEWIIPQLLEEQSLVVIAGEPGCGKSFLATSLAVSLAAGKPWLDQEGFTPARQYRVLYLSPEGYRSTLGRLHENFQRRDIDPESVDFALSRGNLSQAKAEDYDEIIEYAPDIIFVDTWARAIPGVDENSATQVGSIIAALDELRDILGCTVILVHHTAIDKDRMRGTSALKGAVDTEILVRDHRHAQRGCITMTVDKHKNAPAWSNEAELQISESPFIPGIGFVHFAAQEPPFAEQ